MRIDEAYEIAVIVVDAIEQVVVDVQHARERSHDGEVQSIWHKERLVVESRNVRFLTEQLERRLLGTDLEIDEASTDAVFVRSLTVNSEQLIEITWWIDIRAGYVRSGIAVLRSTAVRLAKDLANLRLWPAAASPPPLPSSDPARTKSLLADLDPPPPRSPAARAQVQPARRAELMDNVPPEYHGLELVTAGREDASVAVHYRDGKVVLEVGARTTARQLNFESLKVRVLLKSQQTLTWPERLLQRIGLVKCRDLRPAGYGTWAFEAQLQIPTLEHMRMELGAQLKQLHAGAQLIEDGKPLKMFAVFDQLFDIARQLDAYKAHLTNNAQGRGWVETQVGRARKTLEECLITPVSPLDQETFAKRAFAAAAVFDSERERARAPNPRMERRLNVLEHERQVLVAAALGKLPRYAARVGVVMQMDGEMPPRPLMPVMFGHSAKEFIFANDLSDLADANAIESLLRAGWTAEAIAAYALNRPIERIILDLHVPVNGKQMGAAPITWAALCQRAVGDSAFQDATNSIPIDKLKQVLKILMGGPLCAAGADAMQAGLLDEWRLVTDWLQKHYALNELYFGEGYSRTPGGHVGAHEFMVLSNGTGYALTPENHSTSIIGIITEADFEKSCGYKPAPSAYP